MGRVSCIAFFFRPARELLPIALTCIAIKLPPVTFCWLPSLRTAARLCKSVTNGRILGQLYRPFGQFCRLSDLTKTLISCGFSRYRALGLVFPPSLCHMNSRAAPFTRFLTAFWGFLVSPVSIQKGPRGLLGSPWGTKAAPWVTLGHFFLCLVSLFISQGPCFLYQRRTDGAIELREAGLFWYQSCLARGPSEVVHI